MDQEEKYQRLCAVEARPFLIDLIRQEAMSAPSSCDDDVSVRGFIQGLRHIESRIMSIEDVSDREAKNTLDQRRKLIEIK